MMRTRRPRTTTSEQRKRAAAKKRRARDRKGMTKEDKQIANEYRKAIANDPCFYCGEYEEVMQVDHMIALARGGTSHWFNLTRACRSCNLAKKTRCPLCYLGLTKCKRRCRAPEDFMAWRLSLDVMLLENTF